MNDKTIDPTYRRQGTQPRPTNSRDALLPVIYVAGHAVSLARNPADLEGCLALEGRVRGRKTVPAQCREEGIAAPSAIPYCDFLMLRSARGERLGCCRLLALEPHARGALESGRFHASPFLTALRYSRLGVLEMGSPQLDPEIDTCAAKAAEWFWDAIPQYMDRNGQAFVLGRERLVPGRDSEAVIARLLEEYGLPPDLEVEVRKPYLAVRGSEPEAGARSESSRLWEGGYSSPGLNEALRRGARLIGRPALCPRGEGLEFTWVASREMLAKPPWVAC